MHIKFIQIFSFILLFSNLAFGVNLMKYEVFDSTGEIDIVLSFDQQYNPTIFQNQENGTITITLKDVISEEKYINQLNSKILSEFTIVPFDNSTQIIFYKAHDIKTQALASKDNLSLTLRITNPAFKQLEIESSTEQVSSKNEANPILSIRKYVGFIVGALILLLVLIFAKLFFRKKRDKSLENFFEQNECIYESKTQNLPTTISQVQVIFQKQLDADNRVVMLQFEHKKYLVLLGASNLLLDQFGEDFIHSEEDFQEFFKNNKKSLSEFIQKSQNSLKNYIEKASKY